MPNSNSKGRTLYDHPTHEMLFDVNSNATSRMVLTDTALTVAGDVRAKNFIANCASLNLKGDLIHIKKIVKLNEYDRTDTYTNDHVS